MFHHQVSAKLQIALLAVIGVLLARAPAYADGVVGLSVNMVAEACTANQCDSPHFASNLGVQSGANLGPLSPDITFSNGQIGSEATATTFGQIQFGLILGFVSANATESSSLFPAGTLLAGTRSEAFFDGFWQDTLTATSNTLAPGSPVNLQFSLFATGIVSCSGPVSEVARGIGAFTAGSSQILLSDSTCNTPFIQSQTMTVATFVGAQLPIEGEMQLTAAAQALNDEPGAAAVDPPTTQFFIDSLTPGASYTTGSGNTYFTPTPVPEPSSSSLFIGGLLALFVCGSKRLQVS